MSNLVIRDLSTRYDTVDVLHDVALDVEAGKITCILGANGAGKTTLIRSILGLTPPRKGSLQWDGRDLAGMKTHDIVASGISCIPEGRKVFPRMTVAENLALGAFLEKDEAVMRRRMDKVYEIFPRLGERMGQLAGTMSGGEQAMVSIGRGLMAEPRLLVIDEPSLGLSPLYVKENFNVIKRINELGITVLLVEQNARQTLAISDFGYVLSQGRVVAQGTAQALSDNDEVRSAYFG
ncbi:MAG TPA: ABC transporter ATP-binding protein [Castellaniella sp.]|nr:ABC transporter ATP-binding protein [Castellaniella sp.]